MTGAWDAGIGMTSQRTRDRLIQRLRDEGIRNERVLEAMRATPRHLFMEEALAHRAYEDTALPIGSGQTISQPYIVACMTESLLEGGVPRRVLEIGTGSGYQTAILAQLVDQVVTIERIGRLLEQAQQRLHRLGLDGNVRFRHGDGALGYPDAAPYEGIMVTAAPDQVPEDLKKQLAPGGRLIIPVGPGRDQVLLRITRTIAGFREETLERVVFVPLVGGLV